MFWRRRPKDGNELVALARLGRKGEALQLLDELDPRAGGATLRRSRRLALRRSPTPRHLGKWAKAALGRR